MWPLSLGKVTVITGEVPRLGNFTSLDNLPCINQRREIEADGGSLRGKIQEQG
jgi:hypothetical protein